MLRKFEIATGVLSVGGISLVLAYVIGTQQGLALPFGLGVAGVLLAFVASALLLIYCIGVTAGFMKNKEFMAATTMILLTLWMFKGFWL